jgi:low temperature requirement protein LtrA
MIRRRRPASPDPFVAVKTAIFFLAAGVWLAGVLLDDLRITGAAIVVLAVGVLLRLFPRADSEEEEEGDTVE